MQGDLFKEGQRLTPVFEREQKKKQTIISIEAIVVNCTLDISFPMQFVMYALHRSLLFRYAIRLLESCPLSFALHH